MNEIVADILVDTQTPYTVIFARLFGALLLGAAIGVEREKRQRPAGLRTHILVSLASAIFAVVAIESVHMRRHRQKGRGALASGKRPLRISR